jgi:hypothetical protein
MESETAVRPMARVFFLGDESVYPGWYLQHFSQGRLVTDRLPVDAAADTFTAVLAAAGIVGCVPQQVQIEGPSWHPMRDAH